MPKLREAFVHHSKYYGLLLMKADKLYIKGGEFVQKGMDLFDSNWEHIQAAWKWAVANQEHLHTGIATASRGSHSIAFAK